MQIIYGDGKTQYVYSTVGYKCETNEIDILKTYNAEKERLESQNKEVVLIHTEYDGLKLIKVVFDVKGQYGWHAFSIASENPTDTPIVEVEEGDLSVRKTYVESSDKVTIVAEIVKEDVIFETEKDACIYIGKVCGSSEEITDLKGVLELITEMPYEEIEASAIKEGIITTETKNAEQEIFKYFLSVNGGTELGIETVQDYATYIYYEENDDADKVLSLVVNKNIVGKTYLYSINTNGTYDVRYFENDIIGRETITVTEIQSPLEPGDDVYYSNTNWKVLYNDDIHGLQLISMDVAKTQAYNSQYNYSITSLNYYCRNSITDKSKIAKDTDGIHYKNTTKTYDTYLVRNVGTPFYDQTTEYYTINGTATKQKKDDTYYLEDYEQMEKLGILKINGDTSSYGYWLGSRIVEKDGDNYKFGIRYITPEGNLDYLLCTTINSNLEETANTTYITHYLRPVIKINPSVKYNWDENNNYYTLSN